MVIAEALVEGTRRLAEALDAAHTRDAPRLCPVPVQLLEVVMGPARIHRSLSLVAIIVLVSLTACSGIMRS